MDYNTMFSMLGDMTDNTPTSEQSPYQDNFLPTQPISAQYQPTYQEQPRPLSWEEAFNGFKTRPVLYNMDGYISPFSGNNWGGTSNILQYIDEQFRLPNNENKIDPNKIFTAEVNGLRAIEADQARTLKMFKRKFEESLTEKGKVGLTESDIEAMAAITSATSSLAAIEREKVNIKKNIADIKIKQNQQSNSPVNATGTGPGKPLASADIGRTILDNIFAANMQPDIPTTPVEYNAVTADSASRVIDELIPTVGDSVKFENQEPTTYVVLGETDDDIDFVTYSADGNIIPDYPKPTSTITKIDRESKTATDTYLVSYPIKEK